MEAWKIGSSSKKFWASLGARKGTDILGESTIPVPEFLKTERGRHGTLDPHKTFSPQWAVREADSLDLDVPEAGGTLGFEIMRGARLPADIPVTPLRNVAASACHYHLMAGNRVLELVEMYACIEKENRYLQSELKKNDSDFASRQKSMMAACEGNLSKKFSNLLMDSLKGKLSTLRDSGMRIFEKLVPQVVSAVEDLSGQLETERLATAGLKAEKVALEEEKRNLKQALEEMANAKSRAEEAWSSSEAAYAGLFNELTAVKAELSDAKQNTAESFIRSATFYKLLQDRWEGGVAACKRVIYHFLKIQNIEDLKNFDDALNNEDHVQPYPGEELTVDEVAIQNVDPSYLVDSILEKKFDS